MFENLICYACCGCGGWGGNGWNTCGSCNRCNSCNSCNSCGCGGVTRTIYINTGSGTGGGTTPPVTPSPAITLGSVLVASNPALTATDGPVPLTVSAVYPAGSTAITVSGSTVTLVEPGLYEITYDVSQTGASGAANAELYVNDVQAPATVRDIQNSPNGATYIVNTTVPNSTVQLQLSATTGITSGTANLFIKQYKLPSTTT